MTNRLGRLVEHLVLLCRQLVQLFQIGRIRRIGACDRLFRIFEAVRSVALVTVEQSKVAHRAGIPRLQLEHLEVRLDRARQIPLARREPRPGSWGSGRCGAGSPYPAAGRPPPWQNPLGAHKSRTTADRSDHTVDPATGSVNRPARPDRAPRGGRYALPFSFQRWAAFGLSVTAIA